MIRNVVSDHFYVITWHDARLEAAFDCLADAMAETHPEHGEYAALERARNAVEDADMALERLNNLRRGLPASGMEAPSGGETAQTGSTEGDSPTAESRDAQGISHD